MPKPVINLELCKGCELCSMFCPKNIIKMSGDFNRSGYHYACIEDTSSCNGCSFCFFICPDAAVKIYEKKS